MIDDFSLDSDLGQRSQTETYPLTLWSWLICDLPLGLLTETYPVSWVICDLPLGY